MKNLQEWTWVKYYWHNGVHLWESETLRLWIHDPDGLRRPHMWFQSSSHLGLAENIWQILLQIQIKLLVQYWEVTQAIEKKRSTHCAVYGSWEALVESWPTTSRVEFCCGLVERSPTSSTVIYSLLKELVVLSCAWIPVLHWNHVKSNNINKKAPFLTEILWKFIMACCISSS